MELVLEQREPRNEFDLRFKEMFGITFTTWLKTARCNAEEDMVEYEGGKIFAGMTSYDSGFKVYINSV